MGKIRRALGLMSGTSMDGIDIARFEGGKIAEIWHIEDVMGMMQQLGVIPSPGAPGG